MNRNIEKGRLNVTPFPSGNQFRSDFYLYSMLTFFRLIIKGLLDMGAARKYLLYAIGEKWRLEIFQKIY